MNARHSPSIPAALNLGIDHYIASGKTRFVLVPANALAHRLAKELLARSGSAPLEAYVWDYDWQATDSDPSETGVSSQPNHVLPWVPDVLLICENAQKLPLLSALNRLPWQSFPEVVSFGSAHHAINQLFAEALERRTGETSHAVGYRYAKAHFWEVLQHLSRRGKRGTIVELGVFRGGTLLLLSEMLRLLAFSGNRLIGFDTWAGFPTRRSLLDMYSDELFVCRAFDDVSARLGKQGIELVQGDIVDTIDAIRTDDLLLTFIDTDNYTPIHHALPLIADQTVVGGAIVFDHYFALEEFNDALGEGVAAMEYFAGHPDYLNLSGTGVFLKMS